MSPGNKKRDSLIEVLSIKPLPHEPISFPLNPTQERYKPSVPNRPLFAVFSGYSGVVG
jgi:hypothetical protein